MKALTTQEFISKAIAIHGSMYDYSQVSYVNMHTKVTIVDPEYGSFSQVPLSHLSGAGHPKRGRAKSAKSRLVGRDEFITRAIRKHGNFYDYSLVNYSGIDTRVTIIDPEYGAFEQTPYQHLHSHGCPERTKKREFLTHIDHIIPLSIIHPGNRSHDKWFKDRPLYKFLDSDINKQRVSSVYNITKSDRVTINGKEILCNSVRNNYDVISYLIQKTLDIDPASIIQEDRDFVCKYLGIKT